jgi:hypothetical protein
MQVAKFGCPSCSWELCSGVASLEPLLLGALFEDNNISKEEEAAVARVNREGGQQKLSVMLLIHGHF